MKVGKDTFIFNITSATECPSRPLGLCQIPDKCYAMKAERMYKQNLPYKIRQTKYWDENTPGKIALDFDQKIGHLNAYRKKRGGELIKYVRIGESGDFRNQEDLDKAFKFAMYLSKLQSDVIIYGFTARSDLDFSKRPENYVINGSGFMIDNSFNVAPKSELDKYENVCAGNCRNCDLCKHKLGLDIYVGIH